MIATMTRTAALSRCSTFRYRLGRRWGEGTTLAFVMLNPSTADHQQDDATIRRCIRFAQDHGHEAIDVVNLFAYRATAPSDLLRAGWPVGPDNDRAIEVAARDADAVCVAWGAHAAHPRVSDRVQQVMPILFRRDITAMCLRITRSGYPQHPLMLPSACRLQPFTALTIDKAMQEDA